MNRTLWTTSLVSAVCALGCGSTSEPMPAPSTNSTTNPTTSETSQAPQVDPSKNAESAPKSRAFTFHYRFKIKDLKPTDDVSKNLVRVWMPMASSSDEQDIQRLQAIAPADVAENAEPHFGNKILYFETLLPESGELAVDVPYEVTRREILRGPTQAPAPANQVAKLDDSRRNFFLRADAMVPVEGKSLKLLDMVELVQDKFARARQLYDIVDNHVAYKKEGTGWGRGDTNWVCDSRYGNCTDFHSLFISLARSQGLPSRFEIGFSIPTDKSEGSIAGYHCWAWFYTDERGWIPVDISEADKNPMMKEYYFGSLTPDRVTFSVGRDLELVPKADSPPLNFFIYPHIEVGGKALPKEQIELKFEFKDRA